MQVLFLQWDLVGKIFAIGSGSSGSSGSSTVYGYEISTDVCYCVDGTAGVKIKCQEKDLNNCSSTDDVWCGVPTYPTGSYTDCYNHDGEA